MIECRGGQDDEKGICRGSGVEELKHWWILSHPRDTQGKKQSFDARTYLKIAELSEQLAAFI